MARRGAPEIPVAVGDTLASKYLVERILGAGGMGVVVAAKHLQLGERVALKFLLPEALHHPDVIARFEREGQMAAKVRSEHVARVYDVGTLEGGSPYIVMEYLEGKDLAGVLDERGPLPLEEAVLYLLQVCEALAEAHSLGIVHRDLKPQNLILTRKRDGGAAVKLIDFGISKLMTPTADRHMTQPATMMGSPLYMAPEQMSSARDVDHRSDLWSLGAIFFQLLTAKPPFDGKSVSQVYDLILQGPPKARARRPNLPEGVDAILARCLCKEPSDRFDNVAELAAALVPFGPPLARHTAESIRRVLGAAALTRAPQPSPIGAANAVEDALGPPSIDVLPSEPPERAPPPRAGAEARAASAPKGSAPAASAPRTPPASPLDLSPIPFLSPPIPAPREPPAHAGEIAPDPRAPLPPERQRDARPDPTELLPDPPRHAPAHAEPEETTIRAEDAITEALASHGIAGKVLLKGQQLELHGVGSPIVIDVGPLAEQWPLIPPEMRRRKSADAARRLAEAQRTVASSTGALGSRYGASGTTTLLARLAGGALLLVGAAVVVQLWRKSQEPPPPPPPLRAETPDEERQRLATTCNAMRQRIYSGASVGPYEAGGWAVELWLANKSGPAPRDAPAVLAALHEGKLAPAADEVLGEILDGTLAFDDQGSLPASARSPAWRSTTLVFGGGYARAFFDNDKRARFLGLADRLADAAGAELGSLHARCAHLQVHDVGAWFRGRDPAGATTALLVGVGLVAERPAVDRDALARFVGPGDVQALHEAALASKLDLPTLKSLVGEHGGSVTATPSAVTLTFPVGGPIRATSASRSLAKRLGIGKSETLVAP